MQETGAPGGAPSFPVATNYGAGAGKVPWCFPDWPVPEGVPGKPGTLISSKMAAGAEPLACNSGFGGREVNPPANDIGHGGVENERGGWVGGWKPIGVRGFPTFATEKSREDGAREIAGTV